MNFDWSEFLGLACDLAGRPTTGYSQEAAKRTSVSRAYYATFCCARNYAGTQLGFDAKRNASDHKGLRHHLRTMGEDWTEIGQALDDLRKWRNQCDYDDAVPNLDKLVAEAISAAERALCRFR